MANTVQCLSASESSDCQHHMLYEISENTLRTLVLLYDNKLAS